MLKWKAADGRELVASDFEDSHLVNTIALVQRKCEQRRAEASVEAFVSEDIEDNEKEILVTASWLDYVPEIYPELVAEAKKRELKLKPEVSSLQWELEKLQDLLEERKERR